MTKHRHFALDGVRGLCAISIAAFHFCSWSKIAEFSSIGLFGVYVFFVLSSLTLCIVYSEKFTDQISFAALRDYAVSRFARIFPLLIAVACASFALAAITHHTDMREVLRFVLTGTGLFAFQAPGAASNSAGAWSLGIELLFYCLFPVLCLFANNVKTSTIIIVAAFALVAQLASNSFVILHDWVAPRWPLYVLPLSFAFYFAAGFAIYRVRLKPTVINLWIGIALLSITLGISVFISLSDRALLTGPIGMALPLLIGAAVLLFYNSITPKWLVAVFEFLGAISYSSYLLHPFAYQIVGKLYRYFQIPLALHAVLFAIVTVALAFASYKLWEMPMRLWIRSREKSPMPLQEVPTV